MLYLSLYKRLPWYLRCCVFINLGEINAFTLFTIVSRIKPFQQYGRLKLVTIEMEKLISQQFPFAHVWCFLINKFQLLLTMALVGDRDGELFG